MSLKNYSATSLIGGGSGALDSISGTTLTDLDSAMVFTANTFYFYILDDDSAAAESSPDIIEPAAISGNKRWILIFSMGTSGTITLSNTGLHLLDTGGNHDLIIKPGSDVTADRTLTLTTGDSDRTITLSGNPTLADWFDQAVKAASSPTFANATISTILTLANSGLHVLDTNASHDLIITPGSDLTADRILTITTGDAARTITLSGDTTLADWFDQALKAASSPTFAGLSLTTDLAVTEGGTGASDAANALINLGITATAAEINKACDLTTNAFFTSGGVRKILLYENVAPTGWTIQNTLDDKLVFVTKGSVAGGQTGGGVHSAGTWTQDGCTLTAAQSGLPAHIHNLKSNTGGAAGSWPICAYSETTSRNIDSNATQNAAEAHNHGAIWRPAAYCCIIAALN